MSLLTGMANITYNEAATEAANDLLETEDFLAMETDAIIDTIVDGKAPFDDDDLDDDFDDLDDDLGGGGLPVDKTKCTNPKCTGSCNQCADQAKATETRSGSLGSKESKPSFPENYSDAGVDHNDPIVTHGNSYGYQESRANFDTNYSDAGLNDMDSKWGEGSGSIGQKDSTPKDPSMESAMFLLECATGGDEQEYQEAMEGLFKNIAKKARHKKNIRDLNRDYKARKRDMNKTKRASDRIMDDIGVLGVAPLDYAKINRMALRRRHDDVISYVDKWKKSVKKEIENIDPNDPSDARARKRAGKKLLRVADTTMLRYQTEKMIDKEMQGGLNRRDAKKVTRKRMKEYKKTLKEQNKLKPSTEAAFDIVDSWLIAEEVSNSIGSANSRANFEGNYSRAGKDNNDPIDTNDASVGDENRKASHDTNYGGDVKDTNDPINTGNGSVGQKNSTAKDPAHESYDYDIDSFYDTGDKELSFWDIMNESYEEDENISDDNTDFDYNDNDDEGYYGEEYNEEDANPFDFDNDPLSDMAQSMDDEFDSDITDNDDTSM